ncbi:MAG: hypothetical protein AAB337_04080 [Patescibacteria group bacterium]
MAVQFAQNKISPAKIQDCLNKIRINFEKHGETCRSPRRVLQFREAHCLEAALLVASILRAQGQRPLVVHLAAKNPDDDHVIAVFRRGKYWGAISKSNHAVLRYREPIYRTIRELVMSYFHEYFLQSNRKKTLRSYTRPINLSRFDYLKWETADEDLWELSDALTDAPHFRILTPAQVRGLRLADKIERRAGELIEYII